MISGWVQKVTEHRGTIQYNYLTDIEAAIGDLVLEIANLLFDVEHQSASTAILVHGLTDA